MSFLDTGDLRSWADRSGAAASLPAWVERIIKLGLSNHPEMRFLKGAYNGLPGFDGSIRGANVLDEFKQFIPDGDSIWEFSVQTTAKTKIRSDAAKRMVGAKNATKAAKNSKGLKKGKGTSAKALPSPNFPAGWKPETTTIIFVTPRGISDSEKLKKEIAAKGTWKEVRVIDGQRLFDWLTNTPAVALDWTAEIHGVNTAGLTTFDVAWDDLIGTTEPKLTKEVILAGRDDAKSKLSALLRGRPSHIFVRGDSEFEARAFTLSTLQDDDCQGARARTLVGINYEVARQARTLAPTVFLVAAENGATTSTLSDKHKHHVVVAYADTVHTPSGAIELERPDRWDFAKALEATGLGREEADRLARECGSSVTVMCRRRPSGRFAIPWWANGADAALLRPLILLGGWDTANDDDMALIEEFIGKQWDGLQRDLVNYVNCDDAPLVRVGQVWALGSHVDAFVILAARLSDAEIKSFVKLARKLFTPPIPTDLAKDDPDALFTPPKGPSEWLKRGVAQALLLLSVRGGQLDTQLLCPIPDPRTDKWYQGAPHLLVDALMSELPSLRSFPHLYQSIKDQFVVLMEAAPDPLLKALEHWLEGNADQVQQLLSTKRGLLQEWPDVTELLWGIEVLAWSPEYLFRACRILAMLAGQRPSQGRSESNRPLESLSRILMWWAPQTYSPLAERSAVIDRLVEEFPNVGWVLLLSLRPTGSMTHWDTAKPTMRDMAPAERELLTRRVVYDGMLDIIRKIFVHAGTQTARWIQIIGMMSNFPPEQREEARTQLGVLIDDAGWNEVDFTSLWEAVRDELARHRTFAKTDWALRPEELARWDSLLNSIEPADPVVKIKWLFDDWMPDLDDVLDDASDAQARIDRKRISTIKAVLAESGRSGVLRLARIAKFPSFVGSALGAAISADEELIDAFARDALVDTDIDVQFVASLLWSSAQAQIKTQPFEVLIETTGLLFRLSAWAEQSNVPADRIASALTWLPSEQASWLFVEALGADVAAAFWRRVNPPINVQDHSAASYLLRKMVNAGRAGELADMVAFGKITLDSIEALRLLDAIIEVLSAADSVNASLPRRLRDFLEYLGARDDIGDVDLARREILLVPLLGYHHGLELRLFKALAEEPTLFVDLVAQIYRPASERGEAIEADEASRKLATRSFQLLLSWHNQLNPNERSRSSKIKRARPFPGERIDGTIDPDSLMNWVTTARTRAREFDRLASADNEIGQVLAYSPADTEDNAWPAKAVRAVIEKHYSADLQRGVLNERFNKRGVHAVVEGGVEEQGYGEEAKVWAKAVKRSWPKTHTVLIALSKMWEHDRDRAIQWGKQRKLRQRL